MTTAGERRWALVVGGGGTVGMAYHAGVLRALHQVAGLDPTGADLIVGTSAGSVIGAYLRGGWTTDDFWAMALGTHPSMADLDPAEIEARRRAIFTPAWASPVELARRGIGSAFVLTRSVVRAPRLRIPAPLRRRFPGGFFEMEEAERRFAEELPARWPEQRLYITAVELYSGRRVVFGREGTPEVSLAEAVLASCAIPGVYRPVRAAGMTLVDGGAHSPTNLDLARGYPLVIGVAPMAYEPTSAPSAFAMAVRSIPARALAREARRVRAEGSEVLLVRPTASEIAIHGRNLMRADAGEEVATAAYDSTARLLETDRFRRALARVAAA